MTRIASKSPLLDCESLYCHQFFIGPRYVEGLPGWQRLQISESLNVTYHPELAVHQASGSGASLTLIGQLLDSDDPLAGNEEILEKLLPVFRDIDTLLEVTAGYGGRWLLVAVKGRDGYLFTDALGLRQVFYSDPELSDSAWLVSQPGLIHEVMDVDIDPDTRRFIESPAFAGNSEYAWPAFATPFRQLRHLLPNHYLDINTRACRRYWPGAPIDPVAMDDAADEIACRMRNLVMAAVNRFDELALGITAGLDSRLVLAAARDPGIQLEYVTVRQGGMTDGHPDIYVPAALLGKLGLPHTIVAAGGAMSPAFRELFRENVFLAHDCYGPDAEAILNAYGRRRAVITGSGAEVGRCPYRRQVLRMSGNRMPPEAQITGEMLAALSDKAGNDYAQWQFGEWLAGIQDRSGVHVLDLFSWENGHGNWLAMTQLEFDIAWREIITPYNCRKILTTMMAVDQGCRGYPEYRLAMALIEKMWPDLLQEPINPPAANAGGLRGRIKRAVRRCVPVFG